MNNLNVIFMGTPEFSVPILEYLIENTNVIGIVVQPDKSENISPIKQLALNNNVKIFQPLKIRKEFSDILDMNPDIIITCAYGQIIPKELLDFPKYKAINVHASLLPKYRGGAPIHWSLINGDDKTGITIMFMAPGMDDGDIISQEKIEIKEDDNLDSLEARLSILGRDLLLKTLPRILDGSNKRIKQNEKDVTFAKIIKREDEFLNLDDLAINVHNKIRGLSSVPGASLFLDGNIVKIYSSSTTDSLSKEPGKIYDITKEGILVGTKDYMILFKEVKFEGKRRMFVRELINGINKDNFIGKYFKGEL